MAVIVFHSVRDAQPLDGDGGERFPDAEAVPGFFPEHFSQSGV
jgi:hypothetical protein